MFSLNLVDGYCALPKASIGVQQLCAGTRTGDIFQKKTLRNLCNLNHCENLPMRFWCVLTSGLALIFPIAQQYILSRWSHSCLFLDCFTQIMHCSNTMGAFCAVQEDSEEAAKSLLAIWHDWRNAIVIQLGGAGNSFVETGSFFPCLITVYPLIKAGTGTGNHLPLCFIAAVTSMKTSVICSIAKFLCGFSPCCATANILFSYKALLKALRGAICLLGS